MLYLEGIAYRLFLFSPKMLTKRSFKGSFTQIPNDILYSPQISSRAKIVWLMVWGKPDGWEFSAERISREMKEGVKFVKSGLRELEEIGLLVRKKKSSGRIEYIIFDEPFFETEEEPKAPNGTLGQKTKKPECTKGTLVPYSNTNNNNLYSNYNNNYDNFFSFEEIGSMSEKELDELAVKHYRNQTETGLESTERDCIVKEAEERIKNDSGALKSKYPERGILTFVIWDIVKEKICSGVIKVPRNTCNI